MPMHPHSILALPGALGGPGPLEAVAADFLARGLPWSVRDILADIEDGCDGFDDMTARLVDATRGAHKPLLFGYSMGARLALHALCTVPGHWSGGILVSGHPGMASAGDRSGRLAEDRQWAGRVRTSRWDELLRDWEDRPIFATGTPPAAWRADLRAAWLADRTAIGARRAAVATALEVWSPGVQPDFRPTLAAGIPPVLWLTGGNDAKFTAIGREVAALAPTVCHREIPGCGHRLPWEAPAAVATAVAAWVRGQY